MTKLILYVFHQINHNVLNFINYAIFQNPEYTFVVICNNLKINLSDYVKVPEYVTVIQRPNLGFDFGGWSEAILQDDRYKRYDKFLFINSSVAGPFIPAYYYLPWPEIFFSGLNDIIKLYGSTINNYGDGLIFGYPHVQSFVFALDQIGLEICLKHGIFSAFNHSSIVDVIKNCEVNMSTVILREGYNIGSTMNRYQNYDFREREHYNPNFLLGDPMYMETFIKYDLHPYETVFIKTNRNISPSVYEKYLLTQRLQVDNF